MKTRVATSATVFMIVIGLGLVGCADDKKNTAAEPGKVVSADSSSLIASVCRGTPLITEVGTVTAKGLTKPTGLVASRKNEDMWWLNDDGKANARIWAIDSSSAVRAIVKLKNVRPAEWEDSAVLTDDDGNETVYLADIGDLAAERSNIALHSFEAPDLSDAKKGQDPETVEVDAMTQKFTYPDGAHDAKAMFIDPDAKEFYVITSDPGRQNPPGVYRGELNEGTDEPAALAKLEPFTSAPVQVITSADLSPDSQAIAIRAYGRSGLWERAGRQVMAEVLAKDGCEAPAVPEVQGEGIAFAADGSYYLTISSAGTISKVQAPG